MKNIIKFTWLIPVFTVFATVFFLSLTFVYIEGDDASSIAYHVVGRNPDIQPVYASYQMMMDRALGFFPANESLLRHVSLILTFFFDFIFTSLVLYLGFDYLQNNNLPSKWGIAIAVLAAIPEMLYFGLVYSPTLIGFSFILFSHILIRSFIRRNSFSGLSPRGNELILAAAALMFGVGVSFRWNLIIYIFVIFLDLFSMRKLWAGNERKGLFLALIWVTVAVISSGLMILLSGYNFTSIGDQILYALDVSNRSGTLSSNSGRSFMEELFRTLLNLSPLFTPGFAIVLVIGFIRLIRLRTSIWQVILLGFIVGLPWIKTGTPKIIIVMLPGLILSFIVGLVYLWEEKGERAKTYLYRTGLTLLLIFPWVIGVHATRSSSSWGPSFEVRNYDHGENALSKGSLRIAFDSGAGFPTFEGPRPLYGHAYVLFGGDWREFVNLRAEERTVALNAAISNDTFLVVTNWSPDYYLNELYRMGYSTNDPQRLAIGNGYFTKREFTNAQRQSVTILLHELDVSEVDEVLDELSLLSEYKQNIVLTGHPSVMREMFLRIPDAMDALGSATSIVDICKIDPNE